MTPDSGGGTQPLGGTGTQEQDRHGGWNTCRHFAVAIGVQGDDLLRAPVREPQPAGVPARRLADHEPGPEHLRFGQDDALLMDV
jgi:hypothetical protein